ncbi:unnamed protein product [Lactuca saligna]|uniref:Uncharacterized protein n=1 Tax=Lactuca saligna TaxID=75948 RepID=A0AA35YQ62_LACSI|nr:unnamed protein product [Lactuca saligna]
MSKEIAILQQDYASLNQKMDIITDTVTKFVKLYEALGPQIAHMSTHEAQRLSEITNMLNELKALVLKPGSSPLITPEFLSQKFLLFESVLHKQLAPLSEIVIGGSCYMRLMSWEIHQDLRDERSLSNPSGKESIKTSGN